MRNGTQDVELGALLREQQRLSKQIENKRAEQLRTLHERMGFANINELIAALQSVSPGTANGRHASNGVSVAPEAKKAREPKAKAATNGNGARYSDEVKAAVKSDIEKGESTAREIASRHQVSLPTLNLWKKSWGLTKPRKKKRRAS
jgi:hypothetical protein